MAEKIFLPDFNAKGYEYRHSSGITLLYVQSDSQNNKLDINVSIHTPSLDNRGASHIIEHCIATRSESIHYLSKAARVFQDKTSYEYALPVEHVRKIRQILKDIFEPDFLKDRNIFAVEGWRKEKYAGARIIKGIVYEEIKQSFISPIYKLLNYVPYTLYHGSQYGNLAGGIPEQIVDLSYQDAVDYYHRFYIPCNCCICIYGNIDIEEVQRILSDYFSEYQCPDIKKQLFNDSVAIPVFRAKYLSKDANAQEKDFVGINYAIPKPKTQMEYNSYYFLCNYLYEELMKIQKNETGRVIKIVFKNTLLKPYLSIIFAYCNSQENKVNELKSLTENVIQHVLSQAYSNTIPNYIRSSIYNSYQEIEGVRLLSYIVEAFYSELNPFSYLIQDEKNTKHEVILEQHRKCLLTNPISSIIILRPSLNHRIQSVDHIKNINEHIFKNTDNKKYLVRQPVIESDKEIRYFVYDSDDKNQDSIVHLYFELSYLSTDQLSLCCIWVYYIRYWLVQYDLNNIRVTILPIFRKQEDSVTTKLLITISENYFSVSDILNFIQEILIKDIDEEIIRSVVRNLFTDYNLSFESKPHLFIFQRAFANISLCNLHKDVVRGTEFYWYLNQEQENIDCTIVKINELKKRIIKKEGTIVSIYSHRPELIRHRVDAFIQEMGGNIMMPDRSIVLKNQNEGFITYIHTNYIAWGLNCSLFKTNNDLKYKLLCKLLTNKYIFPTLREQCSAYSSEVFMTENGLVLQSLQTEDIGLTMKICSESANYLKENQRKVFADYPDIRDNYIRGKTYPKIMPENDLQTLKFLYGPLYMTEKETEEELRADLTKQDMELFLSMLEAVFREGSLSVIGNLQCIRNYAHLFDMEYELTPLPH